MNQNIFPTTMPMATKPGRVVIFNEELPPTKLEGPLIMCLRKVMLQIK